MTERQAVAILRPPLLAFLFFVRLVIAGNSHIYHARGFGTQRPALGAVH